MKRTMATLFELLMGPTVRTDAEIGELLGLDLAVLQARLVDLRARGIQIGPFEHGHRWKSWFPTIRATTEASERSGLRATPADSFVAILVDGHVGQRVASSPPFFSSRVTPADLSARFPLRAPRSRHGGHLPLTFIAYRSFISWTKVAWRTDAAVIILMPPATGRRDNPANDRESGECGESGEPCGESG